jgi:hypothetical protein
MDDPGKKEMTELWNYINDGSGNPAYRCFPEEWDFLPGPKEEESNTEKRKRRSFLHCALCQTRAPYTPLLTNL